MTAPKRKPLASTRGTTKNQLSRRNKITVNITRDSVAVQCLNIDAATVRDELLQSAGDERDLCQAFLATARCCRSAGHDGSHADLKLSGALNAWTDSAEYLVVIVEPCTPVQPLSIDCPTWCADQADPISHLFELSGQHRPFVHHQSPLFVGAGTSVSVSLNQIDMLTAAGVEHGTPAALLHHDDTETYEPRVGSADQAHALAALLAQVATVLEDEHSHDADPGPETFEAYHARALEELPSSYEGAQARRIEPDDGDGPDNILHEIRVPLVYGDAYITKAADLPWKLTLAVPDRELNVSDAYEMLGQLRVTVERTQALNVSDATMAPAVAR